MKKQLIVLIAGTSLVLNGCTTLPSTSDPQALRSFDAQAPAEDQGPEDGQAPDLLVRDFFSANARPSQQYQVSRSYLTPEMADKWRPSTTITVVDRLDVNSAIPKVSSSEPRPIQDGSRTLNYDVRGMVVGTVSPGGGYVPANDEFSEQLQLEQVDGQWRISNAPDQVVIERNSLRNHYQPHNAYFFDPGGTTLVPDRRWIFTGTSSLDAAMISVIVNGPSSSLAPGVMNELSPEATYAGVIEGEHHITGLTDLDDDARRRLTAQLVWTLALADIPGPYNFNFDGTSVALGQNGSTDLTVEDFAEFNPQAYAARVTSLYAVRDGALNLIGEGDPAPVDGELGRVNNIESADISSDSGIVAAVTTRGRGDRKRSTLELATVDGEASEVLEAQTLTRPTFELNSNSVWTVLDGTKVARISRSATTNELAQTEVDTTALGDNFGAISVLRLSYTGVRAAFIIDGRVYEAIVSRPNAGERKLTNVQELLPAQDLAAVSLDWQADGALIVGSANPDTPVWRIEQDGSSGQPLSSSNIAAPVVSVAAASNATYVTDSTATLELGVSGAASNFWREIPGLEGERSIVIVPR